MFEEQIPVSPFVNNSEIELYLKYELGENNEESYTSQLLPWLCKTPKFTIFRVNILETTADEVCEILRCHLHKQASSHGNFHLVPVISVHPKLPDVVVISSLQVAEVNPLQKEVIVDAICGAAVLRGAHVFAPGVMGMLAGIHCGDTVSVYADLEGQCKKGFQKKYIEGSKVYLGNGIVRMERRHLFAKDVKPVGIAIEIIASVSGCPVIGDKCLSPSLALLQNLPSIVCCHVLNPQRNDVILDMCAAPGNKTSHLAMLMENEGIVIALDKTVSKVNNIVKRCQQFSLNCVHAFPYDSVKAVQKITESCVLEDQNELMLQGPPFRPESFDRILLDVPCSALGQRPQLANKITVKQLKSYPPLQRKLFKSAVSLLKPGGILVYSTCTVTVSENEGLVQWALEHVPNLELEPAVPMLGGPGLEGCGLTEEQRQCVQKFGPPLLGVNCDHDTVGFFLARFRKKIMAESM